MNTRVTLILSVLLIGIAVFYFIDNKKSIEKNDAEKKKSQVFSLDATEADSLLIARKNEVISLGRKNNTWEILSPVEATASSEKITMLLNILATLKIESIVSEDGNDNRNLSDYGLKPPEMIVTLYKDKKEESLLVGKPNYTGSSLYAKKDGDNKIFIVSNIGFSDFKSPASSYAETAIFSLQPTEVTGIEIESEKKSVKMIRKDDIWSAMSLAKEWKITAPVQEKGDRLLIETYLNVLRNLPNKHSGRTLTPPKTFSSKITLTSGKRTESLFISNISDKLCKIEALPGGDTFTVARKEIEKLADTDPEKFKDHRILTIKPSFIHYIRLESPQGTAELHRKRGVWLDVKNQYTETANMLLWHLSELRRSPHKIIDKSPSRGEISIILKDAGGKELSNLKLSAQSISLKVEEAGNTFTLNDMDVYNDALAIIKEQNGKESNKEDSVHNQE